MDWGLGLESLIGVMEWILGVAHWSEILSVIENRIVAVKFVLGRTYTITKCVKMHKLYK